MMDSLFQKEFDKAQAKLTYEVRLGKVVRFLSFGILNRKAGILKAQLLLNESKENLERYIEICSRETKLESINEFNKLNNVRIGADTNSDIHVIGRQDYGKDWDIIREVILSRDNHQCQESDGYCCGVLQVHHVIPLSKGGTNNSHNLITLCQYHHSLKHDHMKRKL
jgi:5-methylcytosine-specific restriction endonuclease McrA